MKSVHCEAVTDVRGPSCERFSGSNDLLLLEGKCERKQEEGLEGHGLMSCCKNKNKYNEVKSLRKDRKTWGTET